MRELLSTLSITAGDYGQRDLSRSVAPVADHGRHDPRRADGDARRHHRGDRAAPHPERAGCLAGSDRVGSHLLSAGRCHRYATGGRCDHDQFGRLRARPDAGVSGFRAHCAGLFGGEPRPAEPSTAARHKPAGKAGAGDCRLRHGHSARAYDGAGSGRLADRIRVVALDLSG